MDTAVQLGVTPVCANNLYKFQCMCKYRVYIHVHCTVCSLLHVDVVDHENEGTVVYYQKNIVVISMHLINQFNNHRLFEGSIHV